MIGVKVLKAVGLKALIKDLVTNHNYGQPFIYLDEAAQNKATQWFKSYFAPTLSEYDD